MYFAPTRLSMPSHWPGSALEFERTGVCGEYSRVEAVRVAVVRAAAGAVVVRRPDREGVFAMVGTGSRDAEVSATGRLARRAAASRSETWADDGDPLAAGSMAIAPSR